MKNRILGVLIGLISGGLTLKIIESLKSSILPNVQDISQSDNVYSYVHNLPMNAKLLMVFAWVISALVMGFVGGWIAEGHWKKVASILGIAFTIMNIFTFYTLPHPLWMAIIGTLIYIPLTYIAARFGFGVRRK